ncbi:hypothetical protein wcw_0014 [Waddlia chondrophila WSU 86-1044]|uniref:Uncharacterized protein n=1 Tax=Waddlia chondrophila (strain ATCC VR-1470 / WSU 86-1044) TaxID=716544 RepID=D6YTD0_WADCW|nr:hypothetical protein wcw_0014 [Waddlia chondrophila WSU 86-1044]
MLFVNNLQLINVPSKSYLPKFSQGNSEELSKFPQPLMKKINTYI